jgi:hypothetical protein
MEDDQLIFHPNGTEDESWTGTDELWLRVADCGEGSGN